MNSVLKLFILSKLYKEIIYFELMRFWKYEIHSRFLAQTFDST